MERAEGQETGGLSGELAPEYESIYTERLPSGLEPAERLPATENRGGGVRSDRPSGQGVGTRLLGARIPADRLEPRLKAAFGARMELEADGSARVYRIVSRRRQLATVIFDDRRPGAFVEAAGPVLDQMELLVDAIGAGGSPDERTAIVSIERTDRDKLRQAIDAYRRGVLRSHDNSSSSLERGYSTAGLALVNFVWQDAASSPETAEPGASYQAPSAGK